MIDHHQMKHQNEALWIYMNIHEYTWMTELYAFPILVPCMITFSFCLLIFCSCIKNDTIRLSHAIETVGNLICDYISLGLQMNTYSSNILTQYWIYLSMSTALQATRIFWSSVTQFLIVMQFAKSEMWNDKSQTLWESGKLHV